MSKPNVPGELRNVDVRFVSLVDKGANRRQFKIFKSADWKEDELEQKEFRSFFRVVKEFFTRKAQDDVPSFNQTIAAVETGDALWRAFESLRNVCIDILASDAEDKATGVARAIDEFRAYLLGRINQLGVTKALEEIREVEKVGRKISTARLKALKDAHALLAQIIAEAEADEEEGSEVTKEELMKMVGEIMEETTKPIVARLEQLEKQAEQPSDDITEVIKAAVQEALKPLEERLETVEKARGMSNKVPEEKVEKQDGFWGGAFI